MAGPAVRPPLRERRTAQAGEHRHHGKRAKSAKNIQADDVATTAGGLCNETFNKGPDARVSSASHLRAPGFFESDKHVEW
jgi:hypothetical protein